VTRGRRRGQAGSGRRVLFLFLAVVAGVAGYATCVRRPERPAGLPPTPVAAPALPRTATGPPARPSGVPADFEPASGSQRGVIAIVIDDVGWDDTALVPLAALDAPLALSVLPGTPRAGEAIALAKRKGWDLMVHLPMEPESGKVGMDAVLTSDGDAAIRERVLSALARVPGALGVNNHQGSKATADPRVVRDVLLAVKEKGLFFLDSRTTPATQVAKIARLVGVPFLSRDVFLDDAAAESRDPGGTPGALDAAWSHALSVAATKGEAVVIGHPHRESVGFLAEALPKLAARGLRPVKVSELVP
jgi:polysaccharide deacetylase 2 family uncharacterized protein YibQ